MASRAERASASGSHRRGPAGARRRWKRNGTAPRGAVIAFAFALFGSRNRTNCTRTGSAGALARRSRVAARSSAGVRNASWIVRDASSAAASCAAAIAASVRDARRVTSAHSWRARATALGSNPNPRADASTSRVALLSETAARSHASAASALASSSRSVDMVSCSRGLRECGNRRHDVMRRRNCRSWRSTSTHVRGASGREKRGRVGRPTRETTSATRS